MGIIKAEFITNKARKSYYVSDSRSLLDLLEETDFEYNSPCATVCVDGAVICKSDFSQPLNTFIADPLCKMTYISVSFECPIKKEAMKLLR